MDSDIKYLIDQGKNFLANQAYKKAESIFVKIVSNNKKFADVYNMLGVIYHQTGQFEKAISHFKNALEINPNYTEAMLNLSVLYNDLGEYKLSKKLLNDAQKLNKSSYKDKLAPLVKAKLSNQHADLGDTYRGLGLYPQAITEFKKALELAPHFYDIRNRLGICLREDNKKAQAIKEFQKIVKEKPSYLDAQIQLGVTLFSSGKKLEAAKLWLKLAKAHPENELVNMYLELSADTIDKMQAKKTSSKKNSPKKKAKKKTSPKKSKAKPK
jgi:tetratricopeptide (TPR) repeat protein